MSTGTIPMRSGFCFGWGGVGLRHVLPSPTDLHDGRPMCPECGTAGRRGGEDVGVARLNATGVNLG